MTSYSIDTSALLDGWARYYPRDVLPDLWDKNLPRLIADGNLVASEVVREELERKSDELLAWTKDQSAFFVPVDAEIWKASQEITDAHTELLKTTRGGLRSGGDPFVIALAQVRGLTVVTGEKRKAKRPTIPVVCDDLRIPCIDFLQLIRDQGWKFRA